MSDAIVLHRNMKLKSFLMITAVAVLYLTAYVFITMPRRLTLRQAETGSIIRLTGFCKMATNSERVMYYLFVPIGKLEQCLTGRRFELWQAVVGDGQVQSQLKVAAQPPERDSVPAAH